jgi:hypothetical protein
MESLSEMTSRGFWKGGMDVQGSFGRLVMAVME